MWRVFKFWPFFIFFFYKVQLLYSQIRCFNLYGIWAIFKKFNELHNFSKIDWVDILDLNMINLLLEINSYFIPSIIIKMFSAEKSIYKLK